MPLIGRENVDKAILKLKESANDDVRGVYFSGLSAVIKGTPVDEGRARNNWFLSENNPSESITDSESKSGSGSISQLSHIPKNVMNTKVFFTNNLPYIKRLEYGWSQQAPDGWVRRTVMAMRKKLRAL